MSDQPSTITRAQLFEVMGATQQEGAAELVEALLAQLGLGEREHFTKEDVIQLVQAASSYTRAQLEDQGSMAGASDPQKAHVRAMLDTVDQHAIPLLNDNH